MDSSRVFRLVMRRGPQPDKVYTLTEDLLTLGREGSSAIAVNDPEVSRQHARVAFQAGGYVIEDLGSTNGTFVNGSRITGPYALSNDDEIGLGEMIVLAYQVSVGAEAETVVSMAPEFDIPLEPSSAPPPPPFGISEPAPASASPPPLAARPESPPPPLISSQPEPEPVSAMPPLPPREREPALPRPPTTATPVSRPPFEPPKDEGKGRKKLMIGCGCLLVIFICIATLVVAGVPKLLLDLWEAPAEFWQDPIGNWSDLFGIIVLLPFF